MGSDFVVYAEFDNDARVVIEGARGAMAALEPDEAESLAHELLSAAVQARELRDQS